MDIKIYRVGAFSDQKQELLATATSKDIADIILSALIVEGISCIAEDADGNRILDN